MLLSLNKLINDSTRTLVLAVVLSPCVINKIFFRGICFVFMCSKSLLLIIGYVRDYCIFEIAGYGCIW